MKKGGYNKATISEHTHHPDKHLIKHTTVHNTPTYNVVHNTPTHKVVHDTPTHKVVTSEIRHKGGKKRISTKKRGGAITDDLKNLAVPFAILLAKQGLDHVKNNKTTSKSMVSPSSIRRKSTLSGGNCSPCNGAGIKPPTQQMGGKMKKLSKAIDNFLKKY